MTQPDATAPRSWLADLQDRICAALEELDGTGRFRRDELEGERGGLARPRVLEGGAHIEKAAVNFSHTRGVELPGAATERRPELAGREYEAVSVSLIVHPRNPFAPTSHANFRHFRAWRAGEEDVWWFGGGFDLTPYYGFVEDCVHWHRTAYEALEPHGAGLHARLKAWCDRYFVLHHRAEPRGIGGIFFDDWTGAEDGGEPDFERAFAVTRDAGEHYLPAYLPLLERRVDTPYGEREREWQLVRRGRYAEFNLVWDRGTRFGLQSGGRIESILASLPPLVRWVYDHRPEPGSPEEALLRRFLPPRDWLAPDLDAPNGE